MDYLSFNLRLGEWNPISKTGIAEVLQSPAGEGERYSFLLEVDIPSCAQRAFRTPSTAADLGRRLAEAVLSRESLTLWYESYQIARERGRGLRLRLHIDSWELSRLPWELLYDAHHGEFLVFDPMVSLVRYLRLHTAPPALRQSSTLKILAVVASPSDQAQLDGARELAVLKSSLQELAEAAQAEILTCEHTTHEKLHMVLLENTPDVVHFIGHGEYNLDQRMGLLILEDEQGRSAPLEAPEAARMLRRYGVNLVVLNACETASGAWAGLAPALVRAEIPAVVAMQWPVEDRAAIRFSRTFYKALAMGRTIDECVAEGRIGASAGSPDPNDWAAPVLFLRSLSGRLWTNQISRLRAGRESPAPPQRPTFRGPAAEVPEGPPGEAGPRFKTRGPLLSATDSELLAERPELRRAIRLAQQPSVTQYIAFLSARQTGKTTLLLRLMELLKDAYACVFIDLSVLRAQDARACFRFVAFQLISEFRGLIDDGSFLSERPEIESPVDFLEFLRELAGALPMPRIIMLLDEVGALSPQASDSFFNTLRTVFTQGRGTNNALSKYLCVFSGAVDLFALTFGSNSPLNICEKLYLRDLDLPDVAKIVGQFTKLGVSVPLEAPQRIYALTGGHPYLTMRLCALLEQAKVKELATENIEMAAEQMLMEDDNIRHVIRELDRRPLERRRLRGILFEGRKVPFSRNDPVLASLEMIGAIRAVQPCEVRNALYERALRQYFVQEVEGAQPAARAGVGPADEIEAMYARLSDLRAGALDPGYGYRCGKAWELYASALFSMVPAFSVRPDIHAEAEKLGIVLAINTDAEGGSHWSAYQPAILVECQDLHEMAPEAFIAETLARASAHNVKLIFVMCGDGAPSAGERAGYSGSRGDVCVVLLDDSEVARLLDQRSDLDAHLRNRVLEARLRRI
jgi:hypothetical protein